jgi:hypothetical protein
MDKVSEVVINKITKYGKYKITKTYHPFEFSSQRIGGKYVLQWTNSIEDVEYCETFIYGDRFLNNNGEPRTRDSALAKCDKFIDLLTSTGEI